MLGVEPGSSGGAANPPKHWALSPVSPSCDSFFILFTYLLYFWVTCLTSYMIRERLGITHFLQSVVVRNFRTVWPHWLELLSLSKANPLPLSPAYCLSNWAEPVRLLETGTFPLKTQLTLTAARTSGSFSVIIYTMIVYVKMKLKEKKKGNNQMKQVM